MKAIGSNRIDPLKCLSALQFKLLCLRVTLSLNNFIFMLRTSLCNGGSSPVWVPSSHSEFQFGIPKFGTSRNLYVCARLYVRVNWRPQESPDWDSADYQLIVRNNYGSLMAILESFCWRYLLYL